MNNLKRFLALMLAMSMMLTVVPFGAFATESTDQTEVSTEAVTAAPDSDANLAAVGNESIGHMATKPADGTTTGEPFPENTGGSYSFRIPAMVTLSDGTLVAAADARWNTTFDGGGLDTIVSRSADSGDTWNYTFANYLGDNGNEYNGSSTCFIDPSLAVTADDTIFMLCDLYPYGVALNGDKETTPATATGFNGAGNLVLSGDNHASYSYYLSNGFVYDSSNTPVAGYTVDDYFNLYYNDVYQSNLFFSDSPYKVVRTGFLYLTKSTDGGANWSAPTLLNLKNTSELVCLVGPGRGLVTSNGTIIFPVYSYSSDTAKYTALIYSTDGGNSWKRSASMGSPTISSEATMVELENGKIRTFVRNEHSQLVYVDFNLETGNWGSSTLTGVKVNSDTELSAITYSKTVDGKQVILVSAPAGPNAAGTNDSNGAYRSSGKIFMGTINDDDNLTMNWQSSSVAVTPVATGSFSDSTYTAAQGFFAYSCLTERKDNSVAILYEDNQYGWGKGDGFGYTMDYKTYTESDLEAAFGVTFDGAATGSTTLSDDETDVQVDLGTTDTTGWAMTVEPDQTVTDLSGEYAAYDVTITQADGNNYTGSAKVTLPLGELAGKSGLFPFIITDGKVEKLTATNVDSDSITFTAPHFSVMGVAVDGNTVTVTLDVGETKTIEVAGDYVGATLDGLNTTVADVKLTTLPGTIAVANLGSNTSFNASTVDITKCLYTFTKSDDGSYWTITGTDANGNTVYLYPGNGISGGTSSGYPHTTTPPTGLKVYVTTGNETGSFYISSNLNVWNNGKTTYLNFTRNAYRWNRNESVDTTNCCLYLYCAVDGEGSTEIPGYEKITTLDDLKSGQYLIAAPGSNGNTYVAYPSTDETTLYGQIARVSTEEGAAGTQIAITGNAVGKTSVEIGGVTYSITVNAATAKDTITSSGEVGTAYVLDTDGVIDTDTTYLIVNTGTDGNGNALTNNSGSVGNTVVTISNGQIAAANDTDMAWTFSSSTGGHITNNGYYLEGMDYTLALAQTAKYSYTFANAGNGAYKLYIYNSGWSDYIYWDGTKWATAYASDSQAYNIKSVYLYAKTNAETWTVDAAKQQQRYNDLIGLNKDGYTDDSWAAYENARKEARNLLAEVTSTTYPSQDAAQTALNNLIAAMDALEAAKTALVAARTVNVFYQLNGTTIKTENFKVAANAKTLTLPASIVVNNVAYSIDDTTLDLDVNSSVYVPVTKIGTLGNGFVGYENLDGTHAGSNYVCTVEDKPVTEMTLTTNVSYNLDLADTLTDGQYVVWSSDNTNVAIVANEDDETTANVDENGNVTSVGVGTANIIATVYHDNGTPDDTSDDTLVAVNSIPVTVLENNYDDGDATREVALYVEQVDNTTVWCVINGDTSTAFEVIEGELIYGNFKKATTANNTDPTTTTAFSFFGDPDEAHALVFMNAVKTEGDFYLLHDENGDIVNGDEYFYDSDNNNDAAHRGAGLWQALGLMEPANPDKTYGSSYYNYSEENAKNNAGWQKIKAMVEWAIAKGCDGGQGFTRRWSDEGDLNTNLTFISDPMPKIDKEVNGVLPTSRKQADFRRYTEGMVAAVHELVYFQITITQEVPTVWMDTDETEGAIVYENAWVTDDVLQGAYLYTKKLDQDDGDYDGEIDEAYRVQEDEITLKLNETWTEEQKAAGKRVFEYYLVYEIQESDIPKFYIDNIAELEYDYQSHYSKGAQKGAADAEAKISVVGTAIDSVVIDFGQSFTYQGHDFTSITDGKTYTFEGLTNTHLKGAYVDGTYDANGNYTAGANDLAGVTASKIVCKYGTASVVRHATGIIDDKGYPEYTYTVVYTPTQILQDVDTVLIYGIGDEDREKIINGFLVYPATTVYYEEGFMLSEGQTWDATNAQKATREQTFELLGASQYNEHGELTEKVSNKKNAYGYDPIYDLNIGDSGNSQFASTTAGAATSFIFTGTGFDLYANCTEETGFVSVMVENMATGKVVKMYTVNTIVGEDYQKENDSTDGQEGSMYSLPIVSNQDLEHGTYRVTLRKIGNDNKLVQIDGVRVFNTIDENEYRNEDKTSNSPFAIDLEDDPKFYQLRDYVLSALKVNDETSADYGSLDEMAEQVYQQVVAGGEAPAVILEDSTGAYTSDEEVQNLLDNGPKNELYLHTGETLVFNVKTSRAMQIGLKAPVGETSYSIAGAGNTVSGDLNSTVDMFYALNNTIGTETTYTITITNTGSNILAITDLKICDDPNAAFVSLTAEDIKTALVTMGYGVAENTTTGTTYATVSEALNAAKEGETIKLLTDCTESTVIVASGASLDLNGFKLTASYAVAMDGNHIIDSVGTGALIIGENALVMDEENAMIPVYNGEGYIFTKAGFAIRQDNTYTGEGVRIYAIACPMNMDAVELLKDGGADNNVEIVIRMTWDTDQGTGSQNFKFNDDVVASVYSSNTGTWNGYTKMFSMVVTGFESIENLRANIVVVSDVDAECVSNTSINITN